MTRQFHPRQSELNRREVLGLGLAGLSGLVSGSGTGLLVPRSAMSDDSPAKPTLAPLNRFSRMVHEDFVEQVRAAQAKGIAAKAALKTKVDAEAYVKLVQQKIRRCFGPEPERTPLNPRITGVVERDAYRIEKVIFESRPGFLVTANLYVPKGRKLPMPGVVGSCGHSVNGKAAEAYQSFAQGLARQGYVVLIFDPIGQGERLQYVDEQFKPRRGVGVSEHLHAGNQQFLVGEFFGAWRAWDGVRALDYLLSREEVDPKHVGITGNSGGGTMTTWLCGVERRWTMAAPACFVTSFRRNMENELPADTEQCPPFALAEGLDHEDFLAAMAPKPIIILAKERDYFDVRGSIDAHGRLKRLYTLLGAPDNIGLHIGPTEHGYSQENREAMYRWFNRATGISSAAMEPQLTIEKDETLLCTPRGQVAELNSQTVFEFTRATSRELSSSRKTLSPAQLRDTLDDVLRLPVRSDDPPEFRILRSTRPRGYPLPQATSYAVETERGIFALVTRLSAQRLDSRPPQGPERAVLYVSHHSADAELRDEPFVRKLIESEPNAAFFACDVRGIGESCPDTCGGPDQFTKPYGNDYFYAIHSLMLDRPYVGQKTHDLLRVLDWLASFGHKQIHLAASGWGTIPATFAAVLGERIAQVTLKDSLDSYASIAESEDYKWPLSSFVPAVLTRFDLPDCYRVLKTKAALDRVG
ncbi:MAG: prolyl oligopeptidase family serine peptidase [Planctomycetales bacterium]|nr:prolyl oligopeptidase family serine peptidase [Planctomycetales bacterium]